MIWKGAAALSRYRCYLWSFFASSTTESGKTPSEPEPEIADERLSWELQDDGTTVNLLLIWDDGCIWGGVKDFLPPSIQARMFVTGSCCLDCVCWNITDRAVVFPLNRWIQFRGSQSSRNTWRPGAKTLLAADNVLLCRLGVTVVCCARKVTVAFGQALSMQILPTYLPLMQCICSNIHLWLNRRVL